MGPGEGVGESVSQCEVNIIAAIAITPRRRGSFSPPRFVSLSSRRPQLNFGNFNYARPCTAGSTPSHTISAVTRLCRARYRSGASSRYAFLYSVAAVILLCLPFSLIIIFPLVFSSLHLDRVIHFTPLTVMIYTFSFSLEKDAEFRSQLALVVWLYHFERAFALSCLAILAAPTYSSTYIFGCVMAP
jgi:hypothetical protein